MSLFNQLIPSYVLNDKRQIRVAPQMQEPVYIDDVFDPLFNKRAQDYLNAKYGRFLRIPGGYAEMLENMLGNSTKQWGPLGPGMGILGTFGRTIDKAEDFLLGGITEVSHLAGNLNPLGSYTPVKNPLREVFVEDKDYTGQKLLASMTNNMSKLAGGATLDEGDFRGAWNIPSLEIELATDPGILGGSIARHLAPNVQLTNGIGQVVEVPLHQAAQKGAVSSDDIVKMLSKETNIKSAVGEAGQLMSNFDDVLTRASIDITAPGLRPLIKKNIAKIRAMLPIDSANQFINVNGYDPNIVSKVEDTVKNTPTKATKTPEFKKVTETVDKPLKVTTRLNDMTKDLEALQEAVSNGRLPNDEVFESLETKLKQYKNILIANGKEEMKLTDLTEKAQKVYEETMPIVKDINEQLAAIRSLRKYKKTDKFIYSLDNLTSLKETSDRVSDLSKTLDKRSEINMFMQRDKEHLLDDYLNKGNFAVSTTGRPFKDLTDAEKYDALKEAYEIEFPDTAKELDLDYDYMREYEGYELTSKIDKDLFEDLDTEAEKAAAYKKIDESIDWTSPEGKRLYNAVTDRSFDELPITITPNRGYNILKTMQETSFMDDTAKLLEQNLTEIVKEHDESLIEYLRKRSTKKGDVQELVNKLGSNNIDEISKKYLDVDAFIKQYKAGNFVGAIDVLKNSDFFKPLLEEYKDVYKHDFFVPLSKKDDLITFYSNLKKFTESVVPAKDMKTISKETYLDASGNIIKAKDAGSSYDVFEAIEEAPNKSLASASMRYSDIDGPYKKFFDTFEDIQTLLNKVDTGLGLDYVNSGDSYELAAGLREKFHNASKSGIDYFKNPDGSLNYELVHMLKRDFPTVNIKFKPAYADHNKVMNVFYANTYNSEPLFSKDYDNVSNFYNLLNEGNLSMFVEQKGSKHIYDNLSTILDKAPKIDEAIQKMNPGEITILLENPKEFIRFERIEKIAQATGSNAKEIEKGIEEAKKYTGPATPEMMYYTTLGNIVDDVQVKNFTKDENSIKAIPVIHDNLTNLAKINEDIDNATLKKIKKPELLSKEKLEWQKLLGRREYGAPLLELRDSIKGDIISKDNFLQELTSSKGLLGIYDVGKSPKGLIEAVNRNADVLNTYGNIVKPIRQQVTIKGNKGYLTKEVVGLIFEQTPNVEPTWKKVFNIKPNSFYDMPFAIPKNATIPKNYVKANEALTNISTASADLHKTFGIMNVSNLNTAHAYTRSKRSSEFLGSIYKQIGYNVDDAGQLSEVLQEMYNQKGSLLTYPITRTLRGNVADWNFVTDVFETDLSRVANSTFEHGILEEKKIRDYVSLFLNGNTKVNNWTNSAEGLWNIIHVKDHFGKESANLTNMVLVLPEYDEQGIFKKFYKYDLNSKEAVTKAFNDGAFYMPTEFFAPFDRMVKKDMKVSNKVYQFINKYLILPFKFGTLANPGFLVSNVSDASFKQALTFSRLRGTPIVDEFAKMSQALNDVDRLNLAFDNVYRTKFLQSLSKEEIERMPLLKVTSAYFENPLVAEKFNSWYAVNKPLLTTNEQNLVDITKYVNENLPTMTSSFGSLELDEASKYMKNKKYEAPKSFVEKRLMGHHYDKHNITTWGVTAGNPISNTVTNWSGGVETKWRSGSVLNYLKDYYKDDASFAAAINADPKLHKKELELLRVRTREAMNMMNAANFNYDNISELMHKVSYIMPFPTFYLKNLGYWLEVVNENPKIIDTIVSTQNTMWHGIDTTKDNFQAEAKGRGSLPMSSIIGQKPSKVFKGVLKPTMTNSMFSAFSTINNPLKDVANRVNPIASPLTRHLQEPENVRYRPYSTDPYEKNIKQGDKNFNKLTYTFHRLNPYDRFLNTYLRTPAKIKTNQAQMSDFLPSIFQPDYSRKEKAKK